MRIRRNLLYWICQLVGWGLFAAIGLFFTLAFGGNAPDAVLIQLVVTVAQLFTSHGLRAIIRRRNWLRLPLRKLILRLLPLLPALSVVSLALIVALLVYGLNVVELSYYTPVRLAGFALNMTLVLTWWTVIYLIVHAFEDRQRAEVERWKLQAALHEAELTALRSQLNPHFVFNSLNNIRALILENPYRARDMVTHLSELLRYSIQFNQHDRVPLGRELDVVRDYLDLETIQFDDRLRYQIEADPALLALPVPPMTVQLLVENAIKHGIARQPQGGNVAVRATRTDNLLTIEVINTGQLQPSTGGTGIGLKNAADRLRLLFGEQTEFSLTNQTANTVAARFRIPLTTA